MSDGALGSAAVLRGAFRGFGVLLVGGLVEPVPARFLGVVAVGWLPLVAVVAFAVAGIVATPPGTPAGSWRQAPVAAVVSYALILPLVQIGAGRIPIVQLGLTTTTAVLVGVLVGLVRTFRTHVAGVAGVAGVADAATSRRSAL